MRLISVPLARLLCARVCLPVIKLKARERAVGIREEARSGRAKLKLAREAHTRRPETAAGQRLDRGQVS